MFRPVVDSSPQESTSSRETCMAITTLCVIDHSSSFFVLIHVMLAPVDNLSSDAEGPGPGHGEKSGEAGASPPASKLPAKFASASSSLLPVTEADLTDDSTSHASDLKELGLRRKRKKRVDQLRPGGLTLRDRLVSDVHCRATLGKVCKSCRRPCLAGFQSGGRFKTFMDFRECWKSTHKLDQDKVVTQH